jgi:hypothetical protein
MEQLLQLAKGLKQEHMNLFLDILRKYVNNDLMKTN